MKNKEIQQLITRKGSQQKNKKKLIINKRKIKRETKNQKTHSKK